MLRTLEMFSNNVFIHCWYLSTLHPLCNTGNIYNLQRTFQNSLTRFLQRLMGLVGGTYWHWPVLSARSGASGKKSRPWPITTTKQSSLGEAWQMVLQ